MHSAKAFDSIDMQKHDYFDGLAQYCGNSSADALELLQSCAKPLMFI